jgi:hypothetical protein
MLRTLSQKFRDQSKSQCEFVFSPGFRVTLTMKIGENADIYLIGADWDNITDKPANLVDQMFGKAARALSIRRRKPASELSIMREERIYETHLRLRPYPELHPGWASHGAKSGASRQRAHFDGDFH